MQLTFTTAAGELIALELADDMELENVKALCEMDLQIPATNMVLSVNGQDLLDDKKSLTEAGLKTGDMVYVRSKNAATASRPLSSDSGSSAAPKKIPKIDFSSIAVPSGSSSARSSGQASSVSGVTSVELQNARGTVHGIKQLMAADLERFQQIKAKHPQLVEAALRDDFTTVAELTKKEELDARREASRRRHLLLSNPDSHEAQQLIQEQIRAQQIEDNFQYAVEHTPESLASVHMLYVNCQLNKQKMKAFVDSGAQISIISREYAEKCNIAHLIDERFQGMAVGVGSQRFTGKIHACQLEIGGAHLTTSFNVLDDNHMQILLGLDMLKRHQMVIDLKRNVLVVGTTGAETSFLPESEIPDRGMGHEGLAFVPNEPDIQSLLALGFSRDKAREALMKSQGNKDAAAALLLSENSTGTSAQK